MAKKTNDHKPKESSRNEPDYKGLKIGGDAGQEKRGSGSDNRPSPKKDDN